MKTVCVYHSIDLDGWMSAAIVKLWHNQQRYCSVSGQSLPKDYAGSTPMGGMTLSEECTFIGYNYGQPIPDLSGYDKIIMVDISFKLNAKLYPNTNPIQPMLDLYNRLGSNFIWIDHHISAITDNTDFSVSKGGNYPINYNGLRSIDYAACELTWQYFFPTEPMPEIVRLLGRYDCFGHKDTEEEQDVIEFQYGARAIIKSFDYAYAHLTLALEKDRDTSIESHIQKAGRHIYEYLRVEAEQVYKLGFANMFYWAEDIGRPSGVPKQCDAKFICINRERFNPINFGIDYHTDGYDGVACFHYDGVVGRWKFSLYNDNGLVDCSLIAKNWDGGGHKGAAGFIMSHNQFTNFINIKHETI